MFKSYGWGGWVGGVGGWWPPRLLRQPQSPLGPFGPFWGWNWVGLGWDWVWGDWGLRGWGLGLDNFCFLIIKVLEKYPRLTDLVERIENEPNIAKWLKSRPQAKVIGQW